MSYAPQAASKAAPKRDPTAVERRPGRPTPSVQELDEAVAMINEAADNPGDGTDLFGDDTATQTEAAPPSGTTDSIPASAPLLRASTQVAMCCVAHQHCRPLIHSCVCIPTHRCIIRPCTSPSVTLYASADVYIHRANRPRSSMKTRSGHSLMPQESNRLLVAAGSTPGQCASRAAPLTGSRKGAWCSCPLPSVYLTSCTLSLIHN